MLWRIAAEVFRLDVPRSWLPYVWPGLEEARLEVSPTTIRPEQLSG